MPQFFIKSCDIKDSMIVIRGDDCHHLLHVRRIKTGDRLMLRGDDGRGYISEIVSTSPNGITALIKSETAVSMQLPDITLYMAILKGSNFEFVIQKAVEIGVNRIIPVITERTIPAPGEKSEKKIDRWSRIASEAAKQCLRESQASVNLPAAFTDVIKTEFNGLKLICHPGAVTQIKECLSMNHEKNKAAIIIGPEGGFTSRELTLAEDAGWTSVNLGLTHLRAETAAVIIPSIVIYEWSLF